MRLRFILPAVLALTAPAAPAASAEARALPSTATVIPHRYVVVLEPSADVASAAARAEALGASVTHSYRHALRGFAARLSPIEVRAVAADEAVAYVAPDRPVGAAGPLGPGHLAAEPQRRAIALDRIDAEASAAASGDGGGTVDVNVAVLDTGIAIDHPDLDVRRGVACTNERQLDDQNGHGTAVSSLIGARDNDLGRVGVAPGANLWVARMLDKRAKGRASWTICALDWVAGTRTDADPGNDVAVVSGSFGGPVPPDDGDCGRIVGDPVHEAVCAVRDAGVVQVYAAHNMAASYSEMRVAPAQYDEVLTATGVRDVDGAPGGLGDGEAACRPGPDDVPAAFSNWASEPADRAHTIAAPAVCVEMAYARNYHLGSGTSAATPQVAGTVALCIAGGECAGLGAEQIASKIMADAAAYNRANPDYGFQGDPLHAPHPDRHYGFLVNASLYGSGLQGPAAPGCEGAAPTIVGTRADDAIAGTRGADVIAGMGGDDRIAGGGGSDRLCGGGGSDSLDGGPGPDRVVGGDDELHAADGDDELAGGPGADILLAGGGDNTLLGHAGGGVLIAGGGRDRLEGGPGRDALFGGGGADALIAFGADDLVDGGSGAPDLCDGGSGEDQDPMAGCEELRALP